MAPPAVMDALWAAGWRHFGAQFFRYSYSVLEDGTTQTIMPLRISLAGLTLTKSQRRTLRRNADTTVTVGPAIVDDEREGIFQRHKERFTHNIPETLKTFMPSAQPAATPCPCVSVEIRLHGRLIAVSYLDVGHASVSSVYAMFEPDCADRSLGTCTMLHELLWAQSRGSLYLYPGYATVEPSHYDYKKAFRPLEHYDWQGHWAPLAPSA